MAPRFTGEKRGPLSGAVGCPKYYLAGAEAIQYQREGTAKDFEMVHWRLLWEDKRYLDGTIPEEERLYQAAGVS